MMIKRSAVLGGVLCALTVLGPSAAADPQPGIVVCVGADLVLIQLDVTIIIGAGQCAAPPPAPPAPLIPPPIIARSYSAMIASKSLSRALGSMPPDAGQAKPQRSQIGRKSV